MSRPEVPEDLTPEELRQLRDWLERTGRGWMLQKQRGVSTARLAVEACLSHHGATGNRRGYSNWYRAVQNWISRDDSYARRPAAGSAEMPQQSGPRGEEPSELAPLLELITGGGD